MIYFDDINISFKQKRLLTNTSFNISKGELYCFIGRNGSGKTSLFKYLKSDNQNRINIRMLQQNQSIESSFGISLWDFLKSFCIFERIFDWEELLNSYLDIFELNDKKRQLIYSLSGGEKQRMFLVQILLGKSELIFLDESFSNLDIRHKIIYYKLLKKEAQERHIPIILIEHDLRFALENANNILFCKTKEQSIEVFVSESRQLFKQINQDFEIDISSENKYVLLKN